MTLAALSIIKITINPKANAKITNNSSTIVRAVASNSRKLIIIMIPEEKPTPIET